MIDRSDLLRYIPMAIFLVVMLAAGAGIVTSFDAEEMEQTVEKAQAYCYQVYGDATVYNAMVVGDHGGLHCDGNDGQAHLHQVPWEYVDQAYEANQSGQTVDFEHSEIAEKCRPFACSPLDIGPLFLYTLVFIGVLGVVLRFRSKGGEP